MDDDLFEFKAIPKYIDFHNENANEDHEKSAYFQGILQPTPLKPLNSESGVNPVLSERSSSNLALLNPAASRVAEKSRHRSHEVLPAKPTDASVPKESGVRPVLAEKNLRASSSLALFNPAASRVAEKARRRSQQIKVQNEGIHAKPTDASAPKIRRSSVTRGKPALSTRVLRSSTTAALPPPSPFRRSSSRCRDVKPEINPRILASVDRLSAPKKRESGITAASSIPPTPQKSASSNLALFNPAASRVAEKVRRRSQQIKDQGISAKPTDASAPKESGVNPVLSERSSSNLALFNPAASRVAEKARRRSQQIKVQNENVLVKPTDASAPVAISAPKIRRSFVPAPKEKVTPLKPDNFNRVLRSYKMPTGTTPAKPLTQPNAFAFRRSSSRCRDVKSDIDPRIRASVDRLSIPRKRESAIAATLRRKV